MHDTSDKYLMMIEPKQDKASRPVCDANVAMALAVLDAVVDGGVRYRGFHICVCGACSDNCQHVLPGGVETNSLMPHYLMWHRAEVPQGEIDKLRRIHEALFPQGT